MSVIRSSHESQKHPTPIPLPVEPAAPESIAATWCPPIAHAVAVAPATPFTDASNLPTLRENLPAPHHPRVALRTAGHRVDINMRRPDLRQAPRFARRDDDRDIPVGDPARRPAVTPAPAAWRVIIDAAHPTNEEPATTVTGVR